MTQGEQYPPTTHGVIPAEAGISLAWRSGIPAFAGMTPWMELREDEESKII